MTKKILLILDEENLVTNSGSGKYIFNFVPSLKEKYELEIMYKPESHNFFSGLYRRLFGLPKLLKRQYKGYIKIFYAEHYLNSVRSNFIDETIVIIHHYPYLLKVKTIMDFFVKIMSYITFNTILKKIKRIIVVSKETENVLIGLGVNKKYITYIPNCIDLSSYKEADGKEKIQIREKLSKKYNIPKDKKRLLYVGTNEARKNLTTLFNVLGKIDDNYILLRVGKDLYPDEKVKNDAIINKYNLSDRYYHLQNLPEEELISIYQTSDIYVMTSLYEGFGRPIIEAQACGLPVVSTKCGALGEVCGDGALLVDNPFNIDEYIECIGNLKNNKDALIGNGIKNANKYGILLNVEILKKLINSFNIKDN